MAESTPGSLCPHRGQELLRRTLLCQQRRACRFLGRVLLAEWVVAVLLVLVCTVWAPPQPTMQRLLTVLLAGTVVTGGTLLWSRHRATHALTPHVHAAAQLLWTGLLVGAAAGRHDVHFHALLALALLTAFRTPAAVVTGALVYSADLALGLTHSIVPVATTTPPPCHWLEHVGWAALAALPLAVVAGIGRRDTVHGSRRQAALVAARTRIEDKVAARTRELVEANQRAEEANHAKSVFLANMSHEIRTPMTAILGYADLLGNPDTDPDEARVYVDTIKRNGSHLLAIINDILDLSKIESRKATVELIPCSLPKAIASVLSLMQVRAREKGLELDVEFTTPVPRTIHTDPTRVRQILLNLISNAIKFTDDGVVRVLVRSTPADERPARIWITVSDTGVGMEQQAADALFTPFTQVDPSTTRRFGGTGLGLAISREFARMLGGDITVRSRVDEGSTFNLWLDPGDLSDTVWTTDYREVMVEEELPRRRRRSDREGLTGRVLLVEDGPDNQRLIGHLLRKLGLQVEIADNGRTGVDRVAGTGDAFDLIVMDMQMPEMDGYTATRHLRQNGCTVPIVALTAHAMSGDREKCLEAGCDEYATKPIDRRRLEQVLRRFLAS